MKRAASSVAAALLLLLTDGPALAGEAGEASVDVAYLPTPTDVVAAMLELAGVGRDDVVYDLGCGDGRIVVMAARKYGAKGIGFDVDPLRIWESRANVRTNDVGDLVQIRRRDIFGVDLSEADVVTLYLLPGLNERLVPQLRKMKPGSRVVSHRYDIEGFEPDEVVRIKSREDDAVHRIYLWTLPLTKDEEHRSPTHTGEGR